MVFKGYFNDLAKSETCLQLQGVVNKCKFRTIVSEVLSFVGNPVVKFISK